MSATLNMPSPAQAASLGPAPNIPLSGPWTAPPPRAASTKNRIDLGEVLARMLQAARRSKASQDRPADESMSSAARQQDAVAAQNMLARMLQLLMNFLRKLAGYVNAKVGQLKASASQRGRLGRSAAQPSHANEHGGSPTASQAHKAQLAADAQQPLHAAQQGAMADQALAQADPSTAQTSTPLAAGVPESWDPADAGALEVAVTSEHPVLNSEFVASFLREQLDAFVDRLIADQASPMSMLANEDTAQAWLQYRMEDIAELKRAVDAQLLRHQTDLNALVQRYALINDIDPATFRAHLQDPSFATLVDKEGNFSAVQRDIARAAMGQRVLELTLEAFADTQAQEAEMREQAAGDAHGDPEEAVPAADPLLAGADQADGLDTDDGYDMPAAPSAAAASSSPNAQAAPAPKTARVSPFARAVQPSSALQDQDDAQASRDAADVVDVLQKIASADILANTIETASQDSSTQTGSEATKESERSASAVVVPFRLKASDLDVSQPVERAGIDSLDRPRQ